MLLLIFLSQLNEVMNVLYEEVGPKDVTKVATTLPLGWEGAFLTSRRQRPTHVQRREASTPPPRGHAAVARDVPESLLKASESQR